LKVGGRVVGDIDILGAGVGTIVGSAGCEENVGINLEFDETQVRPLQDSVE
jgi:hypothetical protein